MDFFYNLIANIGFTLPMALAYNLLFGKGKVFHFGIIATSLIAGYGIYATWFWTGSYALSLLIAMPLTLAVSAALSWLALRLQPDALGVMTIAVHLSVLSVVLNWQSVTRGALGIPRIVRFPFLETAPAFALFCLLGMIVWVIVFFCIDRSSFGRQVAALAEHDWHAAALGVRKGRVYLWTFLLLGVTQIWDNLIYGQYLHLVTTNDYQYATFVFYVMIIVAGGPGSVSGVITSTVLLVSLKEGLRFVPLDPSILGPMRLLLFGLILFSAVWWRRDTLFPKQRSV